jgi:hypothetical protein
VRQLVRKENLEARTARVEERSRNVCITADSTCGSCGARIGTKLFALYPDESVFCYKVRCSMVGIYGHLHSLKYISIEVQLRLNRVVCPNRSIFVL